MKFLCHDLTPENHRPLPPYIRISMDQIERDSIELSEAKSFFVHTGTYSCIDKEERRKTKGILSKASGEREIERERERPTISGGMSEWTDVSAISLHAVPNKFLPMLQIYICIYMPDLYIIVAKHCWLRVQRLA